MWRSAAKRNTGNAARASRETSRPSAQWPVPRSRFSEGMIWTRPVSTDLSQGAAPPLPAPATLLPPSTREPRLPRAGLHGCRDRRVRSTSSAVLASGVHGTNPVVTHGVSSPLFHPSRKRTRRRKAHPISEQGKRVEMITVGVVLLILGLVLHVAILWSIGVLLVLVGAALWILGAMGREVAGRRHYY